MWVGGGVEEDMAELGRGCHAKRAGAFHSNVYEGNHKFPNFREDNTHVSFVNIDPITFLKFV